MSWKTRNYDAGDVFKMSSSCSHNKFKYVEPEGVVVQVGHKKIETWSPEGAIFCTKMTLMLLWQVLTQISFRMMRN